MQLPNETGSVRRTKIVATVGPASDGQATLDRLLAVGMNVARLNFSHGDHKSHGEVLKKLRRAAQEQGRPLAVMQDLPGPKIRLGRLENPRILASGQEVSLVPGQQEEGQALPVDYPNLLGDVRPGQRILLADGFVELQVLDISQDQVRCQVRVGGEVSSRKGVNLPASDLKIDSFTAQDRVHLKAGLEAGVDMVALSFVRHENDIIEARKMTSQAQNPPLLLAKIEKPQAVERFERILDVVDGVMVARGDLGVEMPLEEVPLIQKQIIAKTRRAGKVVITATQMLRSMVDSPRPTRAEAADVANAVLDGTDAVMLSEETAMGAYPVDAVQVMDRICRASEGQVDSKSLLREDLSPLLPCQPAALSRAACWLANDLQPAAIVAATTGGGTARLISRYRPRQPVVGLTGDACTHRHLALSWGVSPALVEPFEDTDQLLDRARDWLLDQGLAKEGQHVILVGGIPVGQPGITNFLKVVEL